MTEREWLIDVGLLVPVERVQRRESDWMRDAKTLAIDDVGRRAAALEIANPMKEKPPPERTERPSKKWR